MEELLRLFAEAYRTSAAQPFMSGWPPGIPDPGAPPATSGQQAPSPAAPPPRAAPAWSPTLPGVPPLPSLFDWIRLQGLIYEESRRIQDIFFERIIAPGVRAAAPRESAAPGSEPAAPREGAAPDARRGE